MNGGANGDSVFLTMMLSTGCGVFEEGGRMAFCCFLHWMRFSSSVNVEANGRD
jgi:hypothetical protein